MIVYFLSCNCIWNRMPVNEIYLQMSDDDFTEITGYNQTESQLQSSTLFMHQNRDKMAAILQTIFTKPFSWTKIGVFLFSNSLTYISKGPIK